MQIGFARNKFFIAGFEIVPLLNDQEAMKDFRLVQKVLFKGAVLEGVLFQDVG